MKCKFARGSTVRLKTVLQRILVFSLTVAVTISSLNLSGVNLKKAYAATTELINKVAGGGHAYGEKTAESLEYYVSTFQSTDQITLYVKANSTGKSVEWNGAMLTRGDGKARITMSGYKDGTWTEIKKLEVTGKSDSYASQTKTATVGYSDFSSYTKIKFKTYFNFKTPTSAGGENTTNASTRETHPDGVAKATTNGTPSTQPPNPSIAQNGHPSDQTVDVNVNATFSVTAQNAVSYQWQTSKDNSTWSNISGATSSSYTVKGTKDTHKTYYRCVVNGEEGTTSVTSNSAKLTVNKASIVTQPGNKGIDENQSVVFYAAYKNAGSAKWQVKTSSTNSNWTDIPNSNSGTLVLNKVPLSSNGNKYRLILTNANGDAGEIISNEVTLTVTEVAPTFTVQPKTQTKIEGQTLYLNASAEDAKSYWWEVSKDEGKTWEKLTDKPGYVEGSTTQILAVHMVQKSQNKYQYRCGAKNITKTAYSNAAILTVADKNVTGIKIEYPYSEVDYGSTMNLDDAYVFLTYDNGEASFGKNDDRLVFEDGTRKKKMTSLGKQDFKVIYTIPGDGTPDKVYDAILTVTVKDLSGPEIESFTLEWETNSDGLTGTVSSNQLTKVKEDKVKLTVNATDNYKSSDELNYEWSGSGITGQTGKSVVLDGNNGSGDYTVTVSDLTDEELADLPDTATRERHRIEQTYKVDVWDYTPPTVKAEMKPSLSDAPFKSYRFIEVDAKDDHGLAEAAYSYDEGLTWSAFNSYTVEKNGIYPVWVKDCAGNITKQEVPISGIDRDAPVITNVEDLKDSGDNVIGAIVHGEDDTSSLEFGYLTESGDIIWKQESQKRAEFLYTSETEGTRTAERNGEGRTFYARDAAGNTASCLYRTNGSQDIVTITVNPTSWVNAQTGVELTAEAKGSYNSNELTGYRWNTGDYGDSIRVYQNGSYNVTLLYADGNEVPTKFENVSNIDAVTPTLKLSEGNGEIIVTAEDAQSGIRKITIQGNEYEEETIVSETDGLSLYETSVPALFSNNPYVIKAEDMVGNVTQQEYRIFTSAPSATDLKASIYPDTWTKEDVEISALVSEELKKTMCEEPYSWNDGKTWTDKSKHLVGKNGSYRYSVKDKAGNVYKSEAIKVSKIDREEPTVVLYRSKSVLSVVTADSGSGIKRVDIKGPDCSKTLFSASKKEVKDNKSDYIVTKTGTYTVTATDYVGNTVTDSIHVTSTGSDPLPSIDDSVITSCLTHAPTEYTRGNVTLTAVLPQDCLPMLAASPYSWDGGKTWVSQPYCIVEKNGTYYLKVKDLNGGIHSSAPHVIENIDRAAPSISVQQIKTGVSVKLYDELSGLKSLKYAVANGAAKTYTYGKDILGVTEKLKLNKDGIYLFTATDVAGNEVSKQMVIKGLEGSSGGGGVIPDEKDKDKDKDSDKDKDKDSGTDKDQDKDSEKDTTPPTIELIEKDGKIIVKITDDGSGIDRLTYSDKTGKETLLTTLDGSSELTYRVKPKEPGKYTFFAYDKDGNMISKSIDFGKDHSLSENSTGKDRDGNDRLQKNRKIAGILILILLLLFLLLLILYILYKKFTEKEEEENEEEENMDSKDEAELYETDQPYEEYEYSEEDEYSEDDDSGDVTF